jgi:hypothetical protein
MGPLPLVSIDVSRVTEGRLDELKSLMRELARFVDDNEPRPLSYQMFLDPEGMSMTVIQVHPDSASMEFHMQAAAALFPRFAGLLTLSRIDLYGEPSETLVRLMRDKGRLLGGAPVIVHRMEAGFTRFSP